MAWSSPLDSRPLRPVPVLWLLAPWTALLVWTAWIAIVTLGAPQAHGMRGVMETISMLGVFGVSIWGGALGLVGTWLWLGLAVPGVRRWGLWLAAALLAAPWVLHDDPWDAWHAIPVIALCICAAALCVIYSIILSRVRARDVWGHPDDAGA